MIFTHVQYTIGALAEIASGRTFFVDNYDRKTKETKVGMMQVTAEVAQWLGRYSSTLVNLILATVFLFYVFILNFLLSSLLLRELGYKNYDIELEDNINLLYWPFVNVYYGAAYAKWLFSCDEKYVFCLSAYVLPLTLIGIIIFYLSTAKHNYLKKCCRKRTEEFVVRAYKGGKTKATHKSTSPIFQRYLYVKETLLSMRFQP